ncbi:MAG: cell division protein ZapA [Betaproteobacteria bacterium]|jgi:cell division protein ZapA|nr:cell division protein ZapA [Betaproteobacteria bacterium]
MKESETLDINLLGKEYQVACVSRERESLLEAVDYLGKRLDETARKSGAGNETVAMMTALNIAHEFLQLLHGRGFDLPTLKRRIGHMQTRIEGVLAQQEKLF